MWDVYEEANGDVYMETQRYSDELGFVQFMRVTWRKTSQDDSTITEEEPGVFLVSMPGNESYRIWNTTYADDPKWFTGRGTRLETGEEASYFVRELGSPLAPVLLALVIAGAIAGGLIVLCALSAAVECGLGRTKKSSTGIEVGPVRVGCEVECK